MRLDSTDELLQISLDEQLSERIIRVSSEFSREDFTELVKVLRENADIFAWSMAYMLGVSPDVITHKLNINLTYHPVKQKRKNFAPD